MMTDDFSKEEKETLKFLERDFNQCFQQMRHYDSQIVDILKFMFTAYSAVIGIAIGLVQFSLKEKTNLFLPAIAIVLIGTIIGISLFFLALRNRVYFVQLARYVNEQRNLFFKFKPLGFENKSRMYVNHNQPPFFNWRSSQLWHLFLISTLNATLAGVLLYAILSVYKYKWTFIICGALVLLLSQLIIAIAYLVSRENKSASKAVFGRE